MNVSVKVGFLAAIVCALLGGSADTGELTADMVREDVRLERRVSVRADGWYFGELCAHLTELTGVAVSANERDGAADPRLIAVFRDAPLVDIMNSMRSLVSYGGAPYLWDSRPAAEGRQYVLSRSLKARRLAAQIVGQVQDDFEADCGRLLALCRLPERELRRLAETEFLADNMLKFPRNGAAWRLLSDALTHEQLARVIRGQEEVTMAAADLPPSGAELLKLVWSEGRRILVTPDGGRRDAPEPRSIRILRDYMPDSPAPALMISIDGSAYAYAGAVPLARRAVTKYTPAWVLQGDAETDAREAMLVRRPTPAPPEPAEGPSLYHRVAQLADAASIGVMLRTPQVRRTSAGPDPYDRTIGHFLDVRGRPQGLLQSKWRGDVLLMTRPSWCSFEADALTWRTEKGLRKSLARADGMTFGEVIELAGSLNEHQAETVATDHPSLSFLRKPGLYAALAQSRLHAQVRSPEGVPFAGRVAEALARKVRGNATDEPTAVRIIEKPMVPETARDGTVTFVRGKGHMWWTEYRHADGTWRPQTAVRRPKESRAARQPGAL